MLLIKNGRIKTMAGADLENGAVLIDDNGKIVAVGTDLAAPEGVEIIDAKGALVTPGCIDAHTHIGLYPQPNPGGSDVNENTCPTTPQLRIIDAINPLDSVFDEAIKNGVTTVCVTPGSANVVGGTAAVLKTLRSPCIERMLIKPEVAMKCAFGENPKNVHGNKGRSPATRMGTAATLRELLFKTRRYLEDKENGKNPAFDMKLEAMIPVIKREMPLKAHAHRADDIMTSIRIAREFDLDMTLDHCTDGAVITPEIKESGYPALLGPLLGGKSKMELASKSFDTPVAFWRAGIDFCIITDATVVPIGYLPLCAALSARAGLPYAEAWHAITINPARILGIADRVGSLEIGKDADLVIWQGDPMTDVAASVAYTVVNGNVVYRTEE